MLELRRELEGELGAQVVFSQTFETCMGLIICFNLGIIVYEAWGSLRIFYRLRPALLVRKRPAEAKTAHNSSHASESAAYMWHSLAGLQPSSLGRGGVVPLSLG